MTLKDTVAALRDCPLLDAMDPGGLKLVAMAGQPLTFLEGEALVTEGEPGDSVFVILQGEAEAVRDGGGAPVRLARLGPGDLIGEIALLCENARTASVLATGPLVALRLPRSVFLALLEDRPEVSLALSRMLARRLSETSRRLALAGS